LLDRHVISEKTQYLIRWQGLSDSEDSWEKEDTISPQLIAEFLSRTAVVSDKGLRGELDYTEPFIEDARSAPGLQRRGRVRKQRRGRVIKCSRGGSLKEAVSCKLQK
jgi:hypothetical protein